MTISNTNLPPGWTWVTRKPASLETLPIIIKPVSMETTFKPEPSFRELVSGLNRLGITKRKD